jgi:phosphatidyl-myo-inositol alpha-mannosyltransferase
VTASPLRIGMFHATLPQRGVKPGGVSVYVHRLAEALTHAGHDVTVASLNRPPEGAPYRHLKIGPEALAGSYFARRGVVPLLLHRLNKLDLDVVHLHGDDWFYLRRRHPSVRTFYGSALSEAIHATRARARAGYWMTFPLEVLSARLASGVYGIGTDSANIYRARGILPIGVEASPDVHRSAAPSILFVGTWEGRKRGRFLRDQFIERVLPAVPDAQLWMVSDRCTESPGVRWMGAPSDEDLSALFCQAWAFCLPSTYEGLGIPYIEAMAHGTPVVASLNPGSHMTLAGGAHGLIVDDDDLGPTLVALLTDGGLRRDWGTSARRGAAAFGWAQVVELHENAYRRAREHR